MSRLKLKSAVGNDRANKPSDLGQVASALRSQGYLPTGEDGPDRFLTASFVDGVKRFQADHGLAPDGVVTPTGPTARLLQERRSGTPRELGRMPSGSAFRLEAPVGDGLENRPNDVAKTKLALFELGYLDEDKTRAPAGLLTEADTDAVRKFQEVKGLKADGWLKPGGETEKALNEDLQGRIEPANLRLGLRAFEKLGGRRLRSFLDRNASSLYYSLILPETKKDFLGDGERNPSIPPPPRPPRSSPNMGMSKEWSSIDNIPDRAPGFLSTPPIKPQPQRGRPPEPPIKGDHKPPEPEQPELPNREDFPQPVITSGDYILILPEPDESLRRPVIAKMRGSPRTRALDGGVGNTLADPSESLVKQFPGLTWEHVGGGFEPRDPARKREKPIEKKQRYVPSINQDDKEHRTTKDSSFPDLSIKVTYRGVEFHVNINTQDTYVDRRPTRREVAQIERLNRNERGSAVSIGVPKPAGGEYLDPIALKQYVEDVVRTMLRAIDADPEAARRNPTKTIKYFTKVRRRDRPAGSGNDQKNK